MSKVYRVYVEKREGFNVEALEILNNLKTQLKLDNLTSLKVVNRYDVQGVSKEVLNQGIEIILSEPMVDEVILEDYPVTTEKVFAIEYLPGQYDQRADACEQCFQLLTGEKGVTVKCAKLIVLGGNLSENDVLKVQKFLINPVDQRLADLEKVEDLSSSEVKIDLVPIIHGFNEYDEKELRDFIKEKGLAMNYDDLKVTQDYFKNEEHRDPTETEIRVLDTYWSDHCRHTTFSTIITDVKVNEGEFKEILVSEIEKYKASRHMVYGINTTRPMTLMDLATISMKELRDFIKEKGLAMNYDDLKVTQDYFKNE